ncbi:MAG: glycosyltransferase family 4 protein [Bacteroides sp.]|nr:glycosyltransferase family 4 protein [Bacteroides sp.]
MKILIVHYRYFISGGPERYLFNLKEALEMRGHEVIPFSIRNARNVESLYNSYFVENIGKSDEVFIDKYTKTLRTYTDLVGREFYSFGVKRKLKKLIADTCPDICYLLVYKRALSPSVIDACSDMGVPVINRISDYNPVCGAASLYHGGKFCDVCFADADRSLLKRHCVKGSKLFSAMRYLSIKLSEILKMDRKISDYVCTNGFMKEMMARRGYDMRKLHVIPTFFCEKPEYAVVDKTMRSGFDVLRLLYIGNIDESKGIYDLVEALEILKRHTSACHLSIVGGLHKEENLRMLDLLAQKNLTEHVTFEPFRSDGHVFEYYLDNHITVLPARWPENLPNTLIESLYFHRPVIVPQWGSFKFTTDPSVAFYYRALSAKSLAETLGEIMANPRLITEKSNACEAFFQVNFAERTHLDSLLNLFNNTLHNKK